MGLHVIIHVRGMHQQCSLRGIQSVASIWCLIRVVLPRSRLLQANRCSHLSSSSLACSCSALGHSPRHCTSRASKSHPCWGLQVDPLRFLPEWPPVVLGWQTQAVQPLLWWGFWQNEHLNFANRWVPERTPDVTPYVAVDTTDAGKWGPGVGSTRTWTHIHTESTKWGISNPLCSANWASDIVQAELLHIYSINPWGGRDHLLFHPNFISVGQLQQPRHDSPKMSLSPSHSHLHQLPVRSYSHGLIYYLGPNHDQNLFRIGCGWYNQ